MGFGGIGIGELAIMLVIVILIFGTKRLKSIGSDIGGAVKGFRRGMNTDEAPPAKEDAKSLENREPDAEFPEQKEEKSRRS
jgi:sec-independent protein translocase protein TatA